MSNWRALIREGSSRKSALKPRPFGDERVTLNDWWDRDTGQYYLPLWPELGSMTLEELKANPHPGWQDKRFPFPFVVIDTGVLLSHPWIAGTVGLSIDWTGEGIEDQHGHGTWLALTYLVHRASFFVGKPKNSFLADRRKPDIYNLKVMDKNEICEDEWIADALRWCVGLGMLNIGLSIGYSEGCYPEEHSVLCEAIERAIESGCSVSVAAEATCPAKCRGVYPVGGKMLDETTIKADVLPAYCGVGECIIPPIGEPARKIGRR